jgi:hypothetical protein
MTATEQEMLVSYRSIPFVLAGMLFLAFADAPAAHAQKAAPLPEEAV